MIYQLPNGKVIYISLEDYLSCTDEELLSFANCSTGEDPPHKMYYGKNFYKEDSYRFKGDELDFTPDDEEPDTIGPIDINNLPDEPAE